MLLIEDDTLVHVDSASDILEHYGVKGMRWGKRKALTSAQKAERKRKLIKAAKIAGGVALAVGGAYAAHKYLKGRGTPRLGFTPPTGIGTSATSTGRGPIKKAGKIMDSINAVEDLIRYRNPNIRRIRREY